MERQWSLSRNRYPRSNHFDYNYDRDDEEDKKMDKKKLEIILTIGEEKYHRRRGKYRDQSWLLLFHRTKVWRNWIEIDIKIVDRDLTRFYRILNWADFKEDETRRSRSLPDSCSAERSREPCPSRPLSRINVTRVRLKPGFNCAPTFRDQKTCLSLGPTVGPVYRSKLKRCHPVSYGILWNTSKTRVFATVIGD